MDKENENELRFGLNIQYDGRDIFQQLADIGRGRPRKKTRHEEWEEFSRKYICERVASIINEQRERDVNGENNSVFKGYVSYEDYVLQNEREKAEEIERIKERFKLYNNDVNNQLKNDLTKLYAGAALEIGSAAIPMGLGGKFAGGLIKAIKPYFGRKISQEVGTGIVNGGLSGAVFGSGRGLTEDKNPLSTAGQDAFSGAVTGGSIGAVAGKIDKIIAGKNLKNFKDSNNYYKNYEQGKNINQKDIGKVILTSNGFKETNKQKAEYFDKVIDLSRNLKNAKYIGKETPKNKHKYNIDYFYRLRGNDVDYLVAHNADSNKNFFHKVTDSELTSPKLEAQSLSNNIITDAKGKFNPSDLLKRIIGWIKH